jgi:hypothetical protein
MDYPPTPHFPSGTSGGGGGGGGGNNNNAGGTPAHPTTTTDMLRVGRDIIGSDARKLQSKREKRGECVSCGERLFKVNFMGKKTPLTTPDRVLSGRCLNCHPLDAVENAAAAVVHAQQQQQQRNHQHNGQHGSTSHSPVPQSMSAMNNRGAAVDMTPHHPMMVAGLATTTTNEVHGYMEVPRILHMSRRGSDEDNMTVLSAITLDHKIRTSSDRNLGRNTKKKKKKKKTTKKPPAAGRPTGNGANGQEDGDNDDDEDDDDDDDDDDESSASDDPQKMPGKKRLHAVAGAVSPGGGGGGGAVVGGGAEGFGIALESAPSLPPPPPPPPPPPALVAVSSTSYQPARTSSIHWMPPAPLHGTVSATAGTTATADSKAPKHHPPPPPPSATMKNSRHSDVEESESTMQEPLMGAGGSHLQPSAIVVGGSRNRGSFDTEEEKAEIQPLHWSSRGSFFMDSQGQMLIEPNTPTSDRSSVAALAAVAAATAAAAPAHSLPTVGENEHSVPLRHRPTEIHIDPTSLPEDEDDGGDDDYEVVHARRPVGSPAVCAFPRTSSHSNSSTPKSSRSPATSSPPANFFEVQIPPSFRKSRPQQRGTPSQSQSQSQSQSHSRSPQSQSPPPPPPPHQPLIKKTEGAAVADAAASATAEPPPSSSLKGWVARSGGAVGGTAGAERRIDGKSDAAVGEAIRACLQRLDDSGRQGGAAGTHAATSATDRVSALADLTSIVWKCGVRARSEVVRLDGLRILTKIVWSEDRKRQGSAVLEAALSLLLAISASETGDAGQDVVLLGTEGGDGCVDALLVAMQTWSDHAKIQEQGCRLLACLAYGSSNNARCNDGSEAGAVAAVIHALASHPSALHVQEWCVRALYNLCALPSHSERNVRAVLTSVLEDGRTAVAVISQVLKRLVTAGELLLVERVCQLYWCLSSSEDARDLMASETASLMVTIIRKLFDPKVVDSYALCEAALGAIANLVRLPSSREYAADVSKVALDVLEKSPCCRRIITEACAVMANSVGAVVDADSVLEANAVPLIVDALTKFEDDLEMVQEGMRAIVALADASSVARSAVLGKANFLQLSAICKATGRSADSRASMCRLISSLLVNVESPPKEFGRTALEVTCSLMSSDPDSCELQASASTCIWFMSNATQYHVDLFSGNVTDCLKSAMQRHPSSESIQHNACAVLWLALSRTDTEVDGRDCICVIVEALKRHLGSSRVLHVACCTLWRIINGAEHLKEAVAETEGAVDAITCVLVFHANNAGILEVATGLLACLSSQSSLVRDLATPERIEAMVDSMRNHRKQAGILGSAVLFLLNAVSVEPDLSAHALRSLAVVIAALKERIECVENGFHRHACCFLWVMAASSETCKAMILELDGISVLMDTLEKFSSVKGIQDAALGAFNELALVSN